MIFFGSLCNNIMKTSIIRIEDLHLVPFCFFVRYFFHDFDIDPIGLFWRSKYYRKYEDA